MDVILMNLARTHFRAAVVIVAASVCGGCAQTGSQLSSRFIEKPLRTLTGGSDEKISMKMSVARIHEGTGNLRNAAEIYEDVVKRNKKNVKAYNRLGVVYSRLSNHAQANQAFMSGLAIEPDNVEILTDFGYALYLNDDLDAAETALQKALEFNPLHERAIINLALIKGYQGSYDESLALYKQVLPAAEAHANLAYIYVQQGEGQLAENHYNRALTLDSELESAAQALIQMTEIKRMAEFDRVQAIARNSNDEANRDSKNATTVHQVNHIP